MMVPLQSKEMTMFAFRRVSIGTLVACTLSAPFAGVASAAPDNAPGNVCYFNDCVPNRTAFVAPTPAYASEKTWTLGDHGSWVAKTNGTIVMIMDHFECGAEFAIVDTGDHWGLLLFDPNWTLTVGRVYPMNIEVDGEIYSGTATADDTTTLILERTTEEFVKAVYTGRHARIKAVRYSFDMTLPEASASMDDAASYRRRPRDRRHHPLCEPRGAQDVS
jgi:hypothetical protein